MTNHESLLREVEEINSIYVVRFCDLRDPALHNSKSVLLESALASIAERQSRGIVLDYEDRYFTPSATILTLLARFHRGLDWKLKMCSIHAEVQKHLNRNGLAEMFSIYPNLRAALEGFGDDVATTQQEL
ncbi:hypothetical protein CKO51_13090 [Rhodopirellula sp. SM50]|nr:STAS domain-containing protein [Rhodopirellula sp. SM50]PAY19063.1 hypothetical protein CKO51_13090 [Rhodopirellula sp. SM50]